MGRKRGNCPFLIPDQGKTMSHLITSQLVEAHQHCPRKAFFLLRGIPEPHPHEYEIAVEERAAKRRIAYLTELALQKPVVISADDLQATCDGLTNGRKRGQREPHLVIGTESPSPLDKARLAFAGYALGKESRHRPSFGVIVPFSGDPKRVKLDPLYSGISKAVDKLREWTHQLPSEPPVCVMGKQCQTCEFRDHCRAEAEKVRQPFPAGQDDTQGGCQVPEEGDLHAYAAFLCLPTTATAKEIVGQNPHAVQCRTPSPGNPREEDLPA